MIGRGEQVAVFNGLVAAASAASVQEEVGHCKVPIEEQLWENGKGRGVGGREWSAGERVESGKED